MLTIEEKELVKHLARGHTDSQIAFTMRPNRKGTKPKPHTANLAVHKLLQKVGARDRLELVVIALVNRWVELPEYLYR